MNVPFSETTLDLVAVLSGFALTMALFFGIREKKHLWFGYVASANFALQCLIIILFHDGSKVRLLAILVLITTVTVGVVVVRKRRLELS